MATLHEDLLKGGLKAMRAGGGAVSDVLTVYLLHANIRRRAWPSLDTLCEAVGCVRDTAMAAKDWLVKLEAIEPVPFNLRVADERNYPRADVMQLTGIIKFEGKVYKYLHVGQSSTEQTIERAQSSTEQTNNSLLSRREVVVVSSGSDELRPEIFGLYERVLGLMVRSPYEADHLKELEATYPIEWIEEAFKISVKQGASKRLSYAVGILGKWKDNGKDTKRVVQEESSQPPQKVLR
jgi:hypothetical protein